MIKFIKDQFRFFIKRIYDYMYQDSICVKTPGLLVDEIFTVNMKIWFLQEKIMGGGTDEEIAKYSKDCQLLNAKRNKLIKSIDELLNFSLDSVSMKTYGN